MQIDGYSLDAQKTKMKAFCDYNEYEIAGENEDAGKSGKSIEGRVSFNQMMEDIKSGKDGVSRQLYHNKETILSDIDSLDYEDKHYQRRKTDLENRLYMTYDKIDEAEELLVSATTKKRALLADKITGDNILQGSHFL